MSNDELDKLLEECVNDFVELEEVEQEDKFEDLYDKAFKSKKQRSGNKLRVVNDEEDLITDQIGLHRTNQLSVLNKTKIESDELDDLLNEFD